MTNLKIIVPLLVLALKVIMKFVVGRKVEQKNFIELGCELPTDIIFLSISFSLVNIFLNKPIEAESVIATVAFIIVSLVVVPLFRRSREISEGTLTRKKTVSLILILLLNYYFSFQCLYISSAQLLDKKTVTEKKAEVLPTTKCDK